MRVFAGGVATETNTFSPIPTGLIDFDVVEPHQFPHPRRVEMNRLMELTQAQGWTFIPGLHAFAQPAGLTTRRAYEHLRDRLLDQLRAALPVDVVFLPLHGAMVADGYDDCEGDLIRRVRTVVGPDTVIGVELDLHCHLTQTMVDHADVIVIYKEYPHTDIAARAEDLFRLCMATARGEIRPTMAYFDCRMISMYLTPFQPMRGFVDAMLAAEGKEGILSLSLAHGFPWGDVPDCGTRMLAITDGNPDRAARVAEQWGRRFYALRHQVHHRPLTLDEGLDRALASAKRPVVLADQSDNPGGGAPSDATFALRALLDRGVTEAGVAMIWDPVVVHLAKAAGEGARLNVRLGGKMGPMSGDPLDLEVTVTGVIEGMQQEWPQQDGPPLQVDCGDAAAFHCRGIDIIVNSNRSQVFSPQVFSHFGIDPTAKRLLVIKSTQHFYAGFAPIAGEILYMAPPGAVAPLFTQIPYRRVDRNKFPWVDDPLG